MGKIKLILILVGVAIIFLVSEALYVYNNPKVLSTYILRTAVIVSAAGKPDIAFYILTKGKIQLPSDQNYKDLVRNYFANISQKHDLPRVYYDLALMSYTNNQTSLTPIFLERSINLDPDFSFWRVELANYYLSIGQIDASKKVLEDCITKEFPRKHCQDYIDINIKYDEPNSVGYLNELVNKFYESRNPQ